jgi:hypothetical protein
VRGARFRFGGVVALLWVFVVVAAYYVAHKPFTALNLLALGQAAAGLLGATLVAALGIGLGRRLLGYMPDVTGLEVLVLSAGVGWGALAMLALALGLLGWLHSWVLWVLTLAGLLACRGPLGKVVLAALEDRAWWLRSRFERLLAVYCGLMLIAALLWALPPPTAWDGLVYHLTAPKLYLATGQVSHPLDLPYLGFPQLVEMLFTWGVGLAGERAAAPIHWSCGLLLVLGLVTAGRRWLGGATGWLAAAILLTVPSIVLLAGWPYVDLALLLYTTLAFLSLACFFEGGPQSRRWLTLSGAFAGLALSTKYTALALLPALALVLLVVQRFNSDSRIRNLQSAICNLLLLCGAALLVWSPWLIKDFLLTGNPTYPFFFGGVYWDDWRAWWYDRPGTGLAYTAPWELLTAPWDMTIWGVEGAAGYAATIGPLFLSLLPLLLLVWRRLGPGRRRWLGAALMFSGVLYGFWLWGAARTALLMQTRLLFPAFGLLALVVGTAVERLRALPQHPLALHWLVRVAVVLVLALTLVRTGLDLVAGNPVGVVLGVEERESWLSRRLGWYHAAVEGINRELPPGSVVLFLWEPRSYHCTLDCRPDALLDRWLHAIHLYGHDAEAIAAAWRKEGFTHVLLYRLGYEAVVEAGFDPLTEADIASLEALQRHTLQEVRDFGGAYTLYRLGEP